MRPEYIPEEVAWYDAYCKLVNITRPITVSRKITITPFPESNGDLAGYVICVEGTPPYALQIVMAGGSDDYRMVIMDSSRVLRVKGPVHWDKNSTSRHKLLWEATMSLLNQYGLEKRP